MKTYEVNAWISTVYSFIVEADSPEEARQKVRDGEVLIDVNKLSLDCYWDMGDICSDDVIELTQTKGETK